MSIEDRYWIDPVIPVRATMTSRRVGVGSEHYDRTVAGIMPRRIALAKKQLSDPALVEVPDLPFRRLWATR